MRRGKVRRAKLYYLRDSARQGRPHRGAPGRAPGRPRQAPGRARRMASAGAGLEHGSSVDQGEPRRSRACSSSLSRPTVCASCAGWRRARRGCGYGLLAGVDEAGRGSLAGPVVAAAVIVDPRCLVPGVDDSKCLTAAERERGARPSAPPPWPWRSPRARRRHRPHQHPGSHAPGHAPGACRACGPTPDCAGDRRRALCRLPFPCLPVIRGDSVSYGVACASILAKVERDRMMVELDRDYPAVRLRRPQGLRGARAPAGPGDLRPLSGPPPDLPAGPAPAEARG